MNDSQKLSHVIDMAAAANFVEAKLSTLGQRLTGNRAPAPPAGQRGTVPAVPTEAEADRPYHRAGIGGVLNPKVILSISEKYGVKIKESEEKDLVRIQKKENELTKIIRGLGFDGIAEERKKAKARLARGKGSAADAAMDKNSLFEARRAAKRQRTALRDSATKTLVSIGKRIEAAARTELPQVEAEAKRLGIDPAQVPLVRDTALACWLPSVAAAVGGCSPREFLRKNFGFKL